MSIMLVAATSSTKGSSALGLLMPLVLMGGIFYFLLIRPQQKRTRQQRQVLSSVDVGDEVLTIGGIFGVVREIDDETITVEISPGTKVKLARNGVARKLEEEEPEPDDSWLEGETEEGGKGKDG